MKCEFCGKEKISVKKRMTFYRHGFMCKDCYDEDMAKKEGLPLKDFLKIRKIKEKAKKDIQKIYNKNKK